MKINSIKIENIGAHKSTEIDFNDLPGTVAITGQNGTGKTFLLEAVPACLYGSFPTRPGSIYDRVTQGFEGKAEIKVEFEMNGKNYIACREIIRKGKTPSSKANLEEIINTLDTNNKPARKWMKVAGPKVKDFDQAIVNLLGPQSNFLASVFSSQKNTGDVCDARPAERKAVFASLIGLEKFDKLSQAAKENARAMESDLASQEASIEGFRDQASDLKETKAIWKSTKESYKKSEAILNAKKSEVDKLEAEAKKGEVAIERWKALDRQCESLDSETMDIESSITQDREEYKRLKKIIDRADDINKAEADLEKAATEKDKLQASLLVIEKENAEAQREHDKKISNLKLAASDAKALTDEVGRLRDQAGLLEKTPQKECCQGCSLVASAVKAKDGLAGAAHKLKEAQDIARQIEGTITPLESQSDTALNSRLKALTGEISRLKELTSDSAELRAAEGSVATLVESGKSKAKMLADKKEKRAKILEEANEAAKLCPSTTLNVSISRARAERDDLQSKFLEIISSVSSLKERVLNMEKAESRANELEKGIAGRKQEVADLKEIERAFGRSGIQPLIIEQARPELEEIADQMLGTATNGKMRVRFETQKELKSGDMAESLDIIVSRDGFDLDISEFSGGEQKVIRTAIRLTLAVWQARRGGNRLKTIFLDEVFDSLDSENSELMLVLIESLRNQFDRILLISHDDDLLEGVPARINLTKKGMEIIR